MASSNPWDPVQPTPAGLMLARALSAGAVSQVGRLVLSLQKNNRLLRLSASQALKKGTLDICGKPSACFTYISEAEQIADLQTEVSRINLETETLQMEKDTADITHPFYLTQKCQALQAMNRHLDAVLKDKLTLRQKLVKPLCRESLPIEAAFHRDVVELLALAAAFIEKLESHLLTIRNVLEIPEDIRNMKSALAKVDLLATETEQLAEQILEWREKQKGIFENTQLIGGLDSFFKSIR